VTPTIGQVPVDIVAQREELTDVHGSQVKRHEDASLNAII